MRSLRNSDLTLMSQFTVVIPFIGPAPAFDDTLASVLRSRPTNSQVIVVHDGTYSDPYQLGNEVDFVRASKSNRLIAFWNAAIARTVGNLVVFLRPGVELDEGWDAECREAFADANTGCVSPKVIRADKACRVLAQGIVVDKFGTRKISGGRAADEIIGPTSFAAAYRTEALGWIDELDSNWQDEYLDAYLALALNRIGYRCELAENWLVAIDSINDISESNQAPHGFSAARAVNHFGQPLNRSLVKAIGTDLLFALRGIWRLQHGFGRLSSTRFSATDRRFAARLNELRARRESIAAEQATRRAA